MHRQAWVCMAPGILMAAFAEDRQAIRTAGDLAAVLMESLDRYQQRLKSTTPVLELWNEEMRQDRKKYFKPKDENNVSNCLTNFFREDLEKLSLVAKREVQIRPNLIDPAQLTDIDVTAIPFGEDGSPNDRVEVVVEVKCAWNAEILEDMEKQLFERYMKNADVNFGIYVVAHFGVDWNWGNDPRQTTGQSKTSLNDLRKILQDQAQSLSSSEKMISVFIIDARL